MATAVLKREDLAIDDGRLSGSSVTAVKPLDETRREFAETGDLLEFIPNHVSKFYTPNREEEGEAVFVG